MNDTIVVSFDQETWSRIDDKRGRLSRTDFLRQLVVSTLKNTTKPSGSLERWLGMEKGK